MTGNRMRSLATVAVMFGAVAMFNSYGQFDLAAGQQAVVQEGKAPARVSIDADNNPPLPDSAVPSAPTAIVPATRPAAVPVSAPAVSPAAIMNMELELMDKVDLGIKTENDKGSACFMPDGKKILAEPESDKGKTNQVRTKGGKLIGYKNAIYVLLSLDSKDKKEIQVLCSSHVSTNAPIVPPPDRRGSISPDGSIFSIANFPLTRAPKRVPFLLCGVDGKTIELPSIDDNHASIANNMPGTQTSMWWPFNFSGVFDNNGLFYYVLEGLQFNSEMQEVHKNTSICIYRFDPQKNTAQKMFAIDNVEHKAIAIAISSDRTKIAGIGVSNDNPGVWVYDIKLNKATYTKGLNQSEFTFDLSLLPQVTWSQDNTKVYLTSAKGSLYSCNLSQPGKTTPQERENYNLLAVKLGSGDFKQREAATAELRAAEAKAIEALKEAADSSDSEVAERAKMILADTVGIKNIINAGNQKHPAIKSFAEISPGCLYIAFFDGTAAIVNTTTCEMKKLAGFNGLELLDKFGDMGLFRDSKNNLWTAKIVFKPSGGDRSATQQAPVN
ncbi:MAG: hypothetical protein HZA50_03670 [Planctomycetes bacterium]|nr:hypothetical protein [Planctomycetota bacterium]